jgi:AsmA protein
VLLVGAAAGYLAATFNPNDYKDEIVRAVKDSKQRTLKLDGDIRLSFFPKLGAELGRVALSEYRSEQPFASVEALHASLALMPLLHGEAVVDEVSVSGLKATLVKRKDGSFNIDDLLSGGGESSGSKVKFDIAGVQVANAELDYLDEASGARYDLHALTLSTGRIANGATSPLQLSVQIKANQPKLDVTVQAKTQLTLDLDRKHHKLAGLELQASGTALDIANLAVKVAGDVDADLGAQAIRADRLTMSATGVQAGNPFDAKLDVPSLVLEGEQFSAERLQLMARLNGANAIAATLTLPKLSGTAQSFGSQALTLAFDATGDKLPGKHVSSTMRGGFDFNSEKQVFDLVLAGGLLQSQVKAKVAVSNFADPFIRFDADVDQFDADLYFPPGNPPKGKEPEQPFDLSALKALNLEGKLHLGALTAARIKSRDIVVGVKARRGMVTIAPFSARLYGGGMSGAVSVNAAPQIPVFTVNQTLTGIDVAPLLKDAADFDTLEGHGTVGLNVTATGNKVSALKKSLNGNVALNLADGAIKGINIAKKLRDVGIGGKSQTQDANKAEKTDFSELKASFKVSNGVAHNDDLSMKSPLLRLSGNGDIDIGNDRMNYLAKATLVKTLEGQGGQDNLAGLTVPVRAQGPFTALKYSLDFAAAVSDSTKQKIQAKKEEVKTRLQDELKGGLKGLFR